MRIWSALEAVSLAIEKVAGGLLAAITVLIVASAIGRYVFASPIPDAFDISRFLLGATILWGFASVGLRGSHIKVDLFAELLPPAARRVVDFFAWSVLLVFTVLLAWKMFARVMSAAASGEATFDLRLPAWPMLALIWAGAAVSVIAIVARLVAIARGSTLEAFEDAGAHVAREPGDE
ncbi:MAG: TRAP transporter small permease [Rhizobiaceae bacterium]|nr:TRAP transporter small permease [Rhizobiaceae bacterium]MCV0406983.1 TRAP transporter small permease [Rhizobiaceae bacterium]